MIDSLFNTFVFAVIAAPGILLITQSHRLKNKPAHISLAACYGLYVLNECVFLLAGRPWYYYSVLVETVLITVVAGVVSGLESSEEGEAQPLAPYGAFLAAILVGVSTYLYLHPQSINPAVALIVVSVLGVNGVLLIRAIEDEAVPYLCVLSLWVLRYFGMYQQWVPLNRVLTLLFVVSLSAYVVSRIRRLNLRSIEENELLLRARNTVVNMLYDISSSEQGVSSLDFTLVRVLEAIIEALSVEGAAVYIREERRGEEPVLRFAHSSGVFWTMQAPTEHGGRKSTFVAAELQRELYQPGEGIVGIVAKSVQSLELDRSHDRLEMQNLGLNPHNIRNVLAVPLRIRENVLGVLVVQNRKHKSSFSGDDIRLLEALNEQAAISINNARIYEELARTHRIREEMSIATDIQKQLLPRDVPDSQNLQVHPFIRPAKEVGGDYYDFIASQPGQHAIVIGDVSGKGLPAGMIMVIAHTTLQIVARDSADVCAVLTRFSKEMYPRMRRGQFMTMNFLLWDDQRRCLRYSAAGHEHILWHQSRKRSSQRIRAGGVAVGLLQDPSGFLSESCLQTEPGDVIVLYTDGITEARNAREEMYSLNRLQASLDRYAHLGDSRQICEKIVSDVTDFTSGADQYDDMTLLVATVT